MATTDDRARLDLERKLFEVYAAPRGYDLERVKADKYDAFKSVLRTTRWTASGGDGWRWPSCIGKIDAAR